MVAQKCAQLPEVFGRISLASRTLAKCDAIAAEVRTRTGIEITTRQVDADDVSQTVKLLRTLQPDLLINVALPYQDLTLMEACLKAGVHYLDTANYEPPEVAKFEYKWQWDFHDRFRDAGLCALLGSGFDPGVTNVFTAFAAKHHFDEIHELDIIDVNGGDHGQAFATNFNPEINIREVTAPVSPLGGRRRGSRSPALSARRTFNLSRKKSGTYSVYRMYHEEMESLTQALPLPFAAPSSGCRFPTATCKPPRGPPATSG